MDKICAYEGCENPLQTGKKYCSRACANRATASSRRKNESGSSVEVVGSKRPIPTALQSMLVSELGREGANVILSEIEDMMSDQVQLALWPEAIRHKWPIGYSSGYGVAIPRPSLKPPGNTKLEPDAMMVQRYDGYVSDIRRDSDITFDDIDRLLKLGPCVMASRLKKGPIMSALSGRRKWSVAGSNNKLNAVVEADLQRLFLRHVYDILTCFDYGTFFGSVLWEQRTAERIGVESGVGKGSKWWVVKKIESAHPSTVLDIIRSEKTNSFAGFRHRRRIRKPQDVVVDPMQALVIPFISMFGNLWGQSMYEPIYDFAFWYEIVMRAFLRYMQRMSTPVTVVYGPNRGTSRRPDGTRISNPEYGLLLAGAAANSSAIYLPSEVDISTGQALWRMEYLDTDQRGDQFIAALQYLGTQIVRGALVGDRAFTQDGETGSYNAGSVHNKVTQIDNDFLFKSILGYLNDYLVIRYAMFNVDYNNPPMLELKADVIDPDEQEVLMKLFATAGNVKLFDGSPLDRVDWEEAFRSINVPILDDEEFEKRKKESADEALEKQKQFQEIGGPGRPPGGDKSQPKFGGNGAQKQPQQDQQKQSRLSVLEHLVDDGLVPVLLTPDQMREFFVKEEEVIHLDSGDAVELARRRPPHRRTKYDRIVSDRPDLMPGQTKREEVNVVDEDFEKKHPRDDRGRFAKVEEKARKEVGDAVKEGMEILDAITDPGKLLGEEMAAKFDSWGYDLLTPEEKGYAINLLLKYNNNDTSEWPGHNPDSAIAGSFEYGGLRLDALNGVSIENVARSFMDTAIAQRGLAEMGVEVSDTRMVLFRTRYMDNLKRFRSREQTKLGPFPIYVSDDELYDGLANSEIGGFNGEKLRTVFGKPEYISYIPVDSLNRDWLRAVTSHEMIHGRTDRDGRNGGPGEEAFTELINHFYLQKRGDSGPIVGSYSTEMSFVTNWARRNGLDSNDLFRVVNALHSTGNDANGLYSQIKALANPSAFGWRGEYSPDTYSYFSGMYNIAAKPDGGILGQDRDLIKSLYKKLGWDGIRPYPWENMEKGR